MTIRDYVPYLLEFFKQCSLRGWCFVKIERGDFLTLKSSETNFTHSSFVFSKYPKLSLVSPKLSDKNIHLLTSLISEFDSQRIISLTSSFLYIKFYIYYADGTLLKVVRIRKFSLIIPKFIKNLFFKTV